MIQQNKNGFALLLTLVVVSVVLALGLSLVDITLKQLTLSGTGRDSEIAFHASYAGAECAQYWRLQKGNELLAGTAPLFSECLSGSPETGTYQGWDVVGDIAREVHLAKYRITWGDIGDKRCTEIDLYMYDARGGSDVEYDITYYGDPSSPETCAAGNVCTILFSRGFNRACADIGGIRTVQREVVLKY